MSNNLGTRQALSKLLQALVRALVLVTVSINVLIRFILVIFALLVHSNKILLLLLKNYCYQKK